MNPKPPRLPHPVFWGLALITIGLLFLLRELDVVPSIGIWTLILLAVGGWLFVGTVAGRRNGWFLPLTLLAIGTFKLLQDVDVIRKFSLWPVVIIALGVSLVLEAGISRATRKEESSPEPWSSWKDL
jgi:hypothetical protein